MREDGTVKVLDFGLAKMLESETMAGSSSLSLSPTITTPAMTQIGRILGTAAYMAPEQARGKVADRRSDVWAFGCVLFEMLTGKRAFAGEDVTDIIAAVVRGEPPWQLLTPETPPAIRCCYGAASRRIVANELAISRACCSCCASHRSAEVRLPSTMGTAGIDRALLENGCRGWRSSSAGGHLGQRRLDDETNRTAASVTSGDADRRPDRARG